MAASPGLPSSYSGSVASRAAAVLMAVVSWSIVATVDMLAPVTAGVDHVAGRRHPARPRFLLLVSFRFPHRERLTKGHANDGRGAAQSGESLELLQDLAVFLAEADRDGVVLHVDHV